MSNCFSSITYEIKKVINNEKKTKYALCSVVIIYLFETIKAAIGKPEKVTKNPTQKNALVNSFATTSPANKVIAITTKNLYPPGKATVNKGSSLTLIKDSFL
jgi:hypothetical protein